MTDLTTEDTREVDNSIGTGLIQSEIFFKDSCERGGNLSSGILSSGILSSGNLSSGNLSSCNLSSCNWSSCN